MIIAQYAYKFVRNRQCMSTACGQGEHIHICVYTPQFKDNEIEVVHMCTYSRGISTAVEISPADICASMYSYIRTDVCR